MDGDGQKQSRNQSDEIARDTEERYMQPEKDVCLPAKVSSSISTSQGCRRGDQSQDRHKELKSKVKMVEAKDFGRGISDLLQGSPAFRQTGVRSEIVSYRKIPIDW